MPLVLVPCTIAAGQSLSNGVPLTAGRLVRIRTPLTWQPANLTFQCSSDDVPAHYRDVYSRFGAEIVISSVRPNTVVGLPAEVTAFLQDAWLKIRSGHAGLLVKQGAQCDFELVLYKGPASPVAARDAATPLSGFDEGDEEADGA